MSVITSDAWLKLQNIRDFIAENAPDDHEFVQADWPTCIFGYYAINALGETAEWLKIEGYCVFKKFMGWEYSIWHSPFDAEYATLTKSEALHRLDQEINTVYWGQ